MVNVLSADYISSLGGYAMSLTGFKYGDNSDITLLFDTGSAFTVLSTKTIFNNINDEKMMLDRKMSIMEELLREDYSKILPRSAFSVEQVPCYACKIRNIKLNNKLLEEFYFYIVNIDKGLALLGNDISSFCTYNHTRLADINIVGFDYDGYVEEFQQKNNKILDLDELLGR